MAKENATPGTTFTGPIEVKAGPNADAFAALPASVSVADPAAPTGPEITALVAAVNALLERLA